MENIVIRAAQKKDALQVARIVCMAIGKDETHELFPMFLELAAMECSPYSYCNALIAEVEGVFAGAIVGYDGARLYELREPLYLLAEKYLGKKLELEEETTAGEYYLDSLAVLPEFRKLGIARKLLEEFINNALANGHKTVGLLVDYENPSAERLYSSFGFERINPATFLGHKMWHLQYSKK